MCPVELWRQRSKESREAIHKSKCLLTNHITRFFRSTEHVSIISDMTSYFYFQNVLFNKIGTSIEVQLETVENDDYSRPITRHLCKKTSMFLILFSNTVFLNEPDTSVFLNSHPITGGQYLRKFFAKHLAIWRQKYIFCSKNEKRVGVRNYVNFHFFTFYKEFHNRFEWSEWPKSVELNTPPNAIKLKLKGVDLGNSIMKMTSFMTPTK